MSRLIPDALAMATAIASRLADPHAVGTPGAVAGGRGRRRPQSLAGGAAGIALLHIERAYTGHGDFINVWPEKELGRRVEKCLRRVVKCDPYGLPE